MPMSSLLLVLLSLGLLGADSVPERDSSRDAKVELGGIYVSAISYFAEKDTFEISNIRDLGFKPISDLGFKPPSSPRYTFWYSVKGVPTRFPDIVSLAGPCDLTTPP